MNLRRRHFPQAGGATVAYGGLAPVASLAQAATSSATGRVMARRRTLVTIFLRGGADGLSLVVPFKEACCYRDLRHTTDFRDVLAEAVRVHLGNSNLGTVLPGREAKRVGLFG